MRKKFYFNLVVLSILLSLFFMGVSPVVAATKCGGDFDTQCPLPKPLAEGLSCSAKCDKEKGKYIYTKKFVDDDQEGGWDDCNHVVIPKSNTDKFGNEWKGIAIEPHSISNIKIQKQDDNKYTLFLPARIDLSITLGFKQPMTNEYLKALARCFEEKSSWPSSGTTTDNYFYPGNYIFPIGGSYYAYEIMLYTINLRIPPKEGEPLGQFSTISLIKNAKRIKTNAADFEKQGQKLIGKFSVDIEEDYQTIKDIPEDEDILISIDGEVTGTAYVQPPLGLGSTYDSISRDDLPYFRCGLASLKKTAGILNVGPFDFRLFKNPQDETEYLPKAEIYFEHDEQFKAYELDYRSGAYGTGQWDKKWAVISQEDIGGKQTGDKIVFDKIFEPPEETKYITHIFRLRGIPKDDEKMADSYTRSIQFKEDGSEPHISQGTNSTLAPELPEGHVAEDYCKEKYGTANIITYYLCVVVESLSQAALSLVELAAKVIMKAIVSH